MEESMIVQLGWFWTPHQGWVSGGVFEIKEGFFYETQISNAQLENTPSGQKLDLRHRIVLPGFINAHCHLELTSLKNRIPKGLSFGQWVGKLQELTSQWDSHEWDTSYRQGVQESLQFGTTRILDVGNRDWSSLIEADELISEVVCFQKEVLGLNPDRLEDIQHSNQNYIPKLSRDFRLIPHAPYSCSKELMNWVLSHEQNLNIHLSESEDEFLFFKSQSGPLWDFVQKIFPQYEAPPYSSGFQYLLEEFQLRDKLKNFLITHANTLTFEELQVVKNLGWSVVHCPRSRQYFDHPQKDWSLYLQEGGQLCLGTDSLASNFSLSLWDELQLFRNENPTIDEDCLLSLVTSQAAKAINVEDEGHIAEGFKANFQVIENDKYTQTPPHLHFSEVEITDVYLSGKKHEF